MYAVGLHGGEALAHTHVPSDVWGVASCDESNTFTSVVAPEWMWLWVGCPTCAAWEVWDLLPEVLRRTLKPWDWVAPCYCR